MSRSRMILAMILTYMVFAILLNSVGTLILISQKAYGVSKEATSVLDAYKDLPIAVVAFLVASWLPRLGYRRGMMLGLVATAAACAMMPLANTFWVMKLMLAVLGVAFAFVKVSVYSSIGLLTEDSKGHASLTSFVEGCFMIGVLAGPWLYSIFIGQQETPDDPVWLHIYWWLVGACVIIIGLLAVSSMDESAATDGHNIAQSYLDMIKLIAVPLVIVFLVSAFLYVLLEQGINTWLPTFNADVLHLSTATSVQLGSLFAASTALGRLGAGLLLRRMSWHWLLVFCLLATAGLVLVVLPLAANAQPPAADGWWHAPKAAFLFPLIGLFIAPIYPSIVSAVLSALPRTRHAAMAGLAVVFSALGGSTGSFVTGHVFARFGGQTAFYLSLIPLALLLPAVLLLKRWSDRRGTTSPAAMEIAQ
ncbi:MFS transporter [Pseudoxanthomonas kalamensis DSM 18571]|uniref:MFS transporter n=1 Tax=Pseudoxanthomonas kalamensis TaxID=289483 RepID=UPI0013907FB2|nr:MFS transporter [Pseudoxanthomonas kalamensis]KAF1712569.1 MFS transporter [Pseudoxanthomonas kalamensis DSM 18571]